MGRLASCLLAANDRQKRDDSLSSTPDVSEVSPWFTAIQMGAHLQLDDALFDGVLDDEASGVDGLELSQAVRAVDRLHFSSGVPPPNRRTEIGRQ